MSDDMVLPSSLIVDKPMPVAMCINWALLGEWWCVANDAPEEEVLAIIHKNFHLSVPPDLVRDRLFGGFGCELDGRRHVYFGTGHYTFLEPESNVAMSADTRLKQWNELLDAALKNEDKRAAFIGGKHFADDAPV